MGKGTSVQRVVELMETRIEGTLDKNPHTLIPYVETEKGHIQPMQLSIHNPMVKDIPNGAKVVLTTTSAIVHVYFGEPDADGNNLDKFVRTPVVYEELPNTWTGYGGEQLGHYLQIFGECKIVRCGHE